MESQITVARREKRSEVAGVGCVIQGLGILAPFVLGALLSAFGVLIGLILLVVLFFVGSAKSRRWVCSNCKNPIASKEVTVCGACQARLE